MKRLDFRFLLCILLFSIMTPTLLAQVPQMFNYQGVAREQATGDPIQNTTIDVRIAILSSVGPDVVLWEEEHSTTTNEFGHFTLKVGDPAASYVSGSAGSFSAIDWSGASYYLRPSIMPSGSSWLEMPPSRLITVPFALLAKDTESKQQLTKSGDYIVLSDGGSVDLSGYVDADQSLSLSGNTLSLSNGGSVDLSAYMQAAQLISLTGNTLSLSDGGTVDLSTYMNQFEADVDTLYKTDGSLVLGAAEAGGSKLAVVSSNDASEEALFEVKRADGQTVFAVYPEAVRMFVAKGDPAGKAPGTRGGFAVAGFDSDDKATPINDLLWLTPDSVRFYIDDTQTGKARTRGGFAVAGFDSDEKALGPQYLNISGSAIPDAIPPSSQILFYPRKDALLAGTIQVEDQSMVGQNSVSLGYLNTASGRWSQAFGYMSEATADYAMAVGKNAIASGLYSYAFGEEAEAIGDNSYAMGLGAKANSVNSMSLGFYSEAGSSSIALGKFAEATGSESFAGGYNSEASGFQSTAIGPGSTASFQGSTAIGSNASATNNNAISLGYAATASGLGSTALGYSSNSQGSYSTALAGSTAGGAYSLASGLGNASGAYASALGYFSNAAAYKSTVVGAGGRANGSSSSWVSTDPVFVVGNSNTTTPSNALTVLKNGNIGINTEYPGFNLQLNGSTTNGTPFFTMQSNGGDVAMKFLGSTGRAFIMGIDDADGAVFKINQANYMNSADVFTISGANRVGINKIADTYNLEVAGNASKSVGGSTWVVLSDARYKEDVRTIENALEKIISLRPVSFNWNDIYYSKFPDGEAFTQYSFIAQEYEDVFPNSVATGDDGFKSIDIHNANIFAIKAIQELNNIVNLKENRIAELEAENADIQSRLDALEAAVSAMMQKE